MRSYALSMAGALVVLCAEATAEAQNAYHVVWDDFRHEQRADALDADRWFNFAVGSFVGDDGVVSTSSHGLSVVASGLDLSTGDPAFAKSMGQDTGFLSAFDHVKWLVVMNHFTSHGVLGFEAEPGHELACEARVSGQIFGTHGHPFGAAVADPDADPRLGAVATSAFDIETFMIFNFLVTNTRIYAFYEHPTFARGSAYGNYAGFTYAVPVLARSPYDRHDLKIAYDKSRGTVRWLVNGVEVFRVTEIGKRIDRQYMLLDRGGDDETFSPNQLDCAMGTFTFLDGYGVGADQTGRGLVQIDADVGTYFDARSGAPVGPAYFLDARSALESRLFGEGAAMQVSHYVVSSLPSP